ncbi:family 3 encapsulin nanocompartment shell protein [Nocardia sp. NPDC050793]|uniref:family 3 encapsulin nanocompartment shell protein n=1 Tax=Nocardia sp. NPDC050793 TaxID=3155159 RepID=UPI0033EDE420
MSSGTDWLSRPHVGLVDDTAHRFTVGEEFARAVAGKIGSDGVVVTYRTHLTSAFPLFAQRPRYAVRDLVKTASAGDRPANYVRETIGANSHPARDRQSYSGTREARARTDLVERPMTDIQVDVDIPTDLLGHTAQLAHFVDYRVLVRLSVRENETLLHGSGDGAVTGLLQEDGIRRHERIFDGVEDLVYRLAAEVEEAGGSFDGLIVHPQQYWDLVRSGTLARLTAVGIKASRTRMIPAGQVMLGDFSAAATMFLPRIGSVELRGNGDGPQSQIRASARFGFAVPLPDHLIVARTN